MKLIAAAAATGLLLLSAPAAQAQLDPYYPVPNFDWCPGGGGGGGFGAYGGAAFCDGIPFPDGTKWHADGGWAMGVAWWNPTKCVVANAPAPPPVAAPGGCGGAWRG